MVCGGGASGLAVSLIKLYLGVRFPPASTKANELYSMKIIVPLRTKSLQELSSKIEQVGNRADMIEIWLDEIYKEDQFFKKFKKLVETCHRRVSDKKIKFLAVCKTTEEKGTFPGTDQVRGKILQQFLDAGGDYVDLDVMQNSEKVISGFISEKLILSFHDFTGTPQDLDDILKQQTQFNPAVHKFAVTTDTQEELDQFLTFINNFPKERMAIFTTMGELGEHGRELIAETGRSWGAFYALDEESRTAKGQKII